MRKAVDITGQWFDRLVAVKKTDQRIAGSIMWECKCKCGKKTKVSLGNLRSGNTTSCGCLRSEIMKKNRITPPSKSLLDRTGQRYGRLVGVKIVTERSGRKVIWQCRCDCGKMITVRGDSLTSGATKSCGCFKMSHAMTRKSILSPDDIPYKMARAKIELNKNKKLSERQEL